MPLLKRDFWGQLFKSDSPLRRKLSRSGKILVDKLQKDDVFFLSSGLAFNVLICLLPILLSFIYVIGLVFQSENTIEVIDNLLVTAFPNQPHAITIRKLISTILSEIVANRKSLGALSLFVLIFISASLFSAMRSVLHRVYEIADRRHLLVSYIIDVLLVLASTVLIVSTILLRSFYHMLKNAIHEIPAIHWFGYSYFVEFFAACASIPLILLSCYLMYRYVPVRIVSKKMAFVSALTTTFLWEVAARVFSWYLSTFKSFSKTYGAYAFLIVLLVWVFYSCLVFVIGAEVGKVVADEDSTI